MSVARRATLAFGVVFVATVCASAVVFALADSSSTGLARYRAQTAALDATMWSLRADFYNYDDQMNMYVAVLAGDRRQVDLAETTYGQAVQARAAMGKDLDRADSLVTDPALRSLLARLRRDYVGYNVFADQTRSAARAGDVGRAVYLSTVGNLEPSNDMMPTLDKASAQVTAVVQAELDALESAQRLLRTVSVGSAVVVAALIGGLAYGMRQMVMGPIERLRSRMVAISAGDGDLTGRVEVTSDDEFGQVALAFNAMLDVLARRDAELAAAQAEREQHLQANYEQQRAAEQQVRTRAQSVIDETAEAVGGELAQLGAQVDVVRSGASTIEGQVGDADAVTRGVLEHATRAEQAVAALEASLRQVAGITALIAGVADQTKLLALNATIEAARAGTAGRGFSVVASEVKELAMATARSTGQIVATVSSLEREAAAVSQTISAMSQGIAGVGEATNVLRDVARQQFAVVEELDRTVGLTTDRIAGMTSLTQRLERRAHRRVPVSGPVVLTTGGRTLRGTMLDVAEGGLRCLVDGAATLAPGTVVTLEVTLAGRAVTTNATVATRRSDAAKSELGVQFVDPPGAMVAAVRELVAEPPAGSVAR